ncbi:hypothetical protein CABS01_16526 [Colletotrichum abscissum]|uniref:uncharacterized protein n=1 Tax=Colletotrichum abscissum TaxID=1671311 RepID=UPI0027D66F73|nr:uncharacterized protein CABS01_16526 [Colletotrichum abscissum]KAK1521572.1 hypothetical protein CABS01_16526 [Colletotrichum abscissum]
MCLNRSQHRLRTASHSSPAMQITVQVLDTQKRPIAGVFVTLHCLDVPHILFNGMTDSNGRPSWKLESGSRPEHTCRKVWNAHWQITVYFMGKMMPIILVACFVPNLIHLGIQLTKKGYVVDLCRSGVEDSSGGNRKQIIPAVGAMLGRRAKDRLL